VESAIIQYNVCCVTGGLAQASPRLFHVQADEYVTGRTFFAMLMFAAIIGAVMWFFVLPALTTYRPSVP
jgi:hypothetical protein